MSLKIIGQLQVKSTEVETRRGTSKRGQSFVARSQYAFAQIGDEVRKVRLRLDEDQAPYPEGVYEVETALNVGNYGDLVVPFTLSIRPREQRPKAATA